MVGRDPLIAAIQKRMAERGFTSQRALAEHCYVPQSAVARVFTLGSPAPKVADLQALCDALDLDSSIMTLAKSGWYIRHFRAMGQRKNGKTAFQTQAAGKRIISCIAHLEEESRYADLASRLRSLTIPPFTQQVSEQQIHECLRSLVEAMMSAPGVERVDAPVAADRALRADSLESTASEQMLLSV